jgi:hypothetical protein
MMKIVRRIVHPTRTDSFPPFTVTAAAPAAAVPLDDGGQVLVPMESVSPELAERFAELIQARLPEHSCRLLPVPPTEAPWTHHLEFVDDDYVGARHWVVVADGFPESALEAHPQGLAFREVVTEVVEDDEPDGLVH